MAPAGEPAGRGRGHGRRGRAALPAVLAHRSLPPVLKSGCWVDLLAFRTADRLQRATPINSVIAWCLMAMTRLGR